MSSPSDEDQFDAEMARLADEANAAVARGELIEVTLPDGRQVLRRPDEV